MYNIPLMIPDITASDIQAVSHVLHSGMLVQGVVVEELETKLADYIGVKHAIAVSSGTSSLHLALIALGIGDGDEVIVPAFSFIATANVVELVGAKPIFVDIEQTTFNIDVTQIEEKITARTKAIIPVHEFGLPCQIEKIITLAEKYKLSIIEDAACALGAFYNNRHVGTFGDFGSFSFHPRKAITGGEGGLITTNNDTLAKKIKLLRNHGMTKEKGKIEFVDIGYNNRLTDIQASLIVSQFKRLDKILAKKEKIAAYYIGELSGHDQYFCLPKSGENNRHSWQTFHILANTKEMRSKLQQFLLSSGVHSNNGAQCIPFQLYYKTKYNLNCTKLFPNAMKAFTNGLAIPCYEKLSDNEIVHITKSIKSYFKSHGT